MNHDYFEYNDVKYKTGTELIMRQFWKNLNGPDKYSDGYYFNHYDDERDWFVYEKNGHEFITDAKGFWERFGGVTGKINEDIRIPQKKRLKESQIRGMVGGWVIYILVMLFAVFFNACIVIWIMATLIFIGWRGNRIEEEGYYVER